MEYQIIVADPPWNYSFSRSKSRSIESHYRTMTTDDICRYWGELEEGGISRAPDSALYLWATAPKLLDAVKVMDAWGYEYKTNIVWDKMSYGMGYWARGRHELVLIGTRGKFGPPAPAHRIPSVIAWSRGEHSRKPDALQAHIEEAWPEKTKIELFARRPRDGWTCVGEEIE